MFPVTLPAVQEASLALQSVGFVTLPQLVSASTASILRLSAAKLPERSVTCGIPNVSWAEQLVPETHLLGRFFQQPELKEFVGRAVGVDAFAPVVQYWTSRYRTDEYINEHRDVRGTVQLLVCLQAPPTECGGALRFGAGGSEGELHLQSGDAVLFFASTKIHSTTPLRPSLGVPAPERMVAVARLFRRDEEPVG